MGIKAARKRKEDYMEEKINCAKNNVRKRYATLIIDPPWDIDQRGRFGAINHYDLMSLEKIKPCP